MRHMEICALETAPADWVTWRELGWEVSERVCRRWWWMGSGCGDIAGMLDFFLTQVGHAVAGFLIPDTDEVLQIDGVMELLTQVGSEQFLADFGGAYMIQKLLDRCRCDLEDMLLEENATAGATRAVLTEKILAEETSCSPRQDDLDSCCLEEHECTQIGKDTAF